MTNVLHSVENGHRLLLNDCDILFNSIILWQAFGKHYC
jgi:hypothetical protein